MSAKAKVVNLERCTSHDKETCIRFSSGRQVRITEDETGDRVDLVAEEGTVVMTVRMTDDGPVIVMEGARLALKSTESLTLEARNIHLKATDKAAIDSDGEMEIASADRMDIGSTQDIHVKGKMLHLN